MSEKHEDAKVGLPNSSTVFIGLFVDPQAIGYAAACIHVYELAGAVSIVSSIHDLHVNKAASCCRYSFESAVRAHALPEQAAQCYTYIAYTYRIVRRNLYKSHLGKNANILPQTMQTSTSLTNWLKKPIRCCAYKNRQRLTTYTRPPHPVSESFLQSLKAL